MAENQNDGNNMNRVARSALVLGCAMVFSQICGLVSKSILGSTFGASAEVDAYLASNRLTETIFNLMAGGALASAFVPTFSAMLDKEDEKEKAWLLASRIGNCLFLVLFFLCVIGFIFAEQVVKYILVPGFSLHDPELQVLTVKLLRIQLPSVLIFGISGLIMGILNTNGNFLFPGLAPAMYQVGIMIGVVVLSKPLGIVGVALGAVLGSLLHFLIQFPHLLRIKGARYYPSLGLKDPNVREIVRLMIPRQIGASAVQLNFLVDNYLASFLAPGSISALSWGLSLMLMPQAAIAQSVATVSLPMFSVQVSRGETKEMRSSLASALRLVLMLAIPATAGLVILAVPIVRVVFERRSFTPEMTSMVACSLVWYGVGLVGHSVVEVVSRAFYAMHDTKTPVFVLFASMVLNMVLNVILSKLFGALGTWPHGGLALANSIATALEMCALLFFMNRKLGGLEGKRIWNGVTRFGVAAAVMAAGLLCWLHFVNAGALITVAGGLVVGVGLYFAVCVLLKVEELGMLKSLVRRRS
ncbi:MAG: murein biosynthesis integral membrane protein MurJ [Anaerolineaceae bacterium]|nr:murein biosynthesis integral membrane protein MurJ [Anaerolineaceae bacterium]